MATRLTIGTFNVENLFVYHRLRKNGADLRFKDQPVSLKDLGYKEPGARATALETGFWVEEKQRRVTAQAVAQNQPDILALQEVEGLDTLRKFRSEFLHKLKVGGQPVRYPYALSIDGNDHLLIDVGLLSKLEIATVRTHMFTQRPTATGETPLFPRDCLEVDFWVDAAKTQQLTLYINHFTSRRSDQTGAKRAVQAQEVVRILRARFGQNLDGGDFIVCGDLNDTPTDPGLAALYDPALGLRSALGNVPPLERWTHYYYDDKGKPKEVAQLDHFLLSPTLWVRNHNGADLQVAIEKRGLLQTIQQMSASKRGPLPPPFAGVTTKPGTEGSDHCPVFVSLLV